MAYPRIYTCDLARARYSSVSSDIDIATLSAQNAVDGDPNTLWEPGVTGTTWKVTLASELKIRAIGISNHNLVGAYVSVYVMHEGAPSLALDATLVATPEDLLLDLGTSSETCTAVWVVVTDAAAVIKVGCISVLGDYGYSSTGVLTEGGGYGIIELGGDGVGGVLRPLPVGGDAGVSVVNSPSGFSQYQLLGSISETFVLPFALLRAARDYELWRLFAAYYPRRRNAYSNPGFSRGVWLTSDEYSTDTQIARYCVGVPDQPLSYQIDHAGSRGSGSLFLRTLPRESVA